MENKLLHYLNERMQTSIKSFLKNSEKQGLLITISREAGCGGEKLCNVLAATLNDNRPSQPWKVISKEILFRSANELKISEKKVERVLKHENYAFDEILAALSEKYYKSNKHIIKWVRNEIYDISSNGCTILLGRAGHIIARDIPGSLHVRFVAPLEWRIRRMADLHNCSLTESLNLIKKIEEERKNFKQHFMKDKEEETFDLTINISCFSPQVIAGIIIYAFQSVVDPER